VNQSRRRKKRSSTGGEWEQEMKGVVAVRNGSRRGKEWWLWRMGGEDDDS
jgi:hypothetical protein